MHVPVCCRLGRDRQAPRKPALLEVGSPGPSGGVPRHGVLRAQPALDMRHGGESLHLLAMMFPGLALCVGGHWPGLSLQSPISCCGPSLAAAVVHGLRRAIPSLGQKVLEQLGLGLDWGHALVGAGNAEPACWCAG